MLHVYRAPSQPATRWHDPNLPKGMRRQEWHPRRQLYCQACGRRRWAKHLRIQVYYDCLRLFCADECEGVR